MFITFNVGPSQLDDQIKNDLLEAYESGILQTSHRSSDFSAVSKLAIDGLRSFLQIPAGYKVFYASSATEAMRLSILNACRQRSRHFVCGSFSKLFADISLSLGREVELVEEAWGVKNNILEDDLVSEADLVAMTQTETSTGAALPVAEIAEFRQKYPDKILAVDVTSSAGGVVLDIAQADIWFFSVQKCFGLPAGLALMIVSPRAYEKSLAITHPQEVFSWPNMWKKMEEKYQTVCTPNVLAIFLLAKKMERWNALGGQEVIGAMLEERFAAISKSLDKIGAVKFFVVDPSARARTVFCLAAEVDYLARIKKKAAESGLVLGGGYGKIKDQTFRLANFPSLKTDDWDRVLELLRQSC